MERANENYLVAILERIVALTLELPIDIVNENQNAWPSTVYISAKYDKRRHSSSLTQSHHPRRALRAP
jgi:hypothetical protein